MEKELKETNVHRKEMFDQLYDALKSTPDSPISTGDDNFTIIKKAFSNIEELGKEIEILQSLHFDSMLVRHSRIPEAHRTTFDWMFKPEELDTDDDRSKIGLKAWLQTEDGIFWVSGKPGSGKSTLMKHLSDHDETAAYLSHWAGDSMVSQASFFFWKNGTEMQKSTQGLLQSLLFEILSQIPDIIPEVCGSRWASIKSYQRSGPWKRADLIKSFDHMRECASINKRFCFFIDGLDEYDGDHFEMIETMLDIVKSPYIKLCLSSRPWNCFEDVFGQDERRKIYMQDLTKRDIERYTTTMLTRSASWNSTCDDKLRQQKFALEIVERAKGVFLWVDLVCRSLRMGFVNGDSLSILEKRLRALPTDLETYFEYILKSIDDVYKEKLGCLLQVALSASEPHYMIIYSFLEEEDPDFSLNLPLGTMNNSELIARKEVMRRILIGRTMGLLEITTSRIQGSRTSAYFLHRVEFLHRTVHDFLSTKDMRRYIQSTIPDTWNASFVLSRACLAVSKTMPTIEGRDRQINATIDFARIAEQERACSDSTLFLELQRTSRERFGRELSI